MMEKKQYMKNTRSEIGLGQKSASIVLPFKTSSSLTSISLA